VALHGGRIGLDEAPEGGARFLVKLPPLSPTAAVAPAATPTPAAGPGAVTAADLARDVVEAMRTRPPPAAAPRRDAPGVLVVEDHPEMAAYIRDVLSGDASVALASSAEAGLELARTLRPQLVITDLMMPGGGGEVLLRELRARPELEEIPVLVLSALAGDETRVRLLREGAQDYLVKPFAPEELRARARGLIATGRVRALLREALDSQARDVETLARELAARKRDLEGALEAARRARDEADRASRIKGNFLALVSHELRTPVTVLQLQLERLQGEPGQGERTRRGWPSMLGALHRLAVLIEALLEQSRVASGRVAMQWDRVDLGAAVEAAVAPLRPEADAKGLTLAVEASPGQPPVLSEPRLLRVVISNLVENAVKFTEAGRVDVQVSGGEEERRVAVTDSGPGIPTDDQESIFQPFVQLDPLHAKHVPGVGLGLSLVRELCAALGARVELRSSPGAGSTFTVVLPIAPAERAELELGTPIARA
jgi:signal transduction histidine kinase